MQGKKLLDELVIQLSPQEYSLVLLSKQLYGFKPPQNRCGVWVWKCITLAQVIYSKLARLDCCTHLRQVEQGPFGRGRACGEDCGAQSVHTWQVKPLWWRVWEVHCCETTPGLLHQLFILVTTSSQSKQPFPLVVLGLCTVEELFSASCVVHSKVSHSHSSNTNFYEVLKKMEFKFFHQQENIRLPCNCSLLFFFINFIWHNWRALLLNVLSTINFQGEGNLC